MPEEKERQDLLVLRAGYARVEEYNAGAGRRLVTTEALGLGRVTEITGEGSTGYLAEYFDRATGAFVALNAGRLFATRREAIDDVTAYAS